MNISARISRISEFLIILLGASAAKSQVSMSITRGPKEKIRIVEGNKTANFCGA